MSAAELRQAANTLRNDEDLADLDAYVPGLCDALSDWLTASARYAFSRERSGVPASESCDPRPLAVARAINGGGVA